MVAIEKTKNKKEKNSLILWVKFMSVVVLYISPNTRFFIP